MALWVCNGCASAYAAGLPQCPHCSRTDYTPDYAGERPEPDHQLPPPPPVSAPKAEHVEYVAEALGVDPEEAAALKKAELVELARSAAEGGEQPSPGGSSSTSSRSERPSLTGSPATPRPPAPSTGSPSSPPPPPTAGAGSSSTAPGGTSTTPATGSAQSGSEEG